MFEEQTKNKNKIYKIIMLVVLTSFLTFMITSLTMYSYYTKNPVYTLITKNNSSTESSELDENISKIRKMIDKYYLWNDEIDESKLTEGAIKGYVESLGDKYTEYIPEEEMDQFTEDINGSFVGIGIYMIADEEKNQIIVYSPIQGSPAEEAGIQSGDVIISVDGIEYDAKNLNVAADNIRGNEGTIVKLVIERDGKKLDFEITRRSVDLNPISSKIIQNNIGYIKFPSFDSSSSEKLKEGIDKLINEGAKSLILDLRNNGGGIVDEATAIADYFLEKDCVILSTMDNNEKQEITKATEEQIYNMPLVILTNENTASASEILTGALKENDRAIVIGTTTYGKGVIQTVITLTDGSGLKITTAEYFTPNGEKINDVGITPNIVVELPESETNIYSVSEENDSQLKRAIEELN